MVAFMRFLTVFSIACGLVTEEDLEEGSAGYDDLFLLQQGMGYQTVELNPAGEHKNVTVGSRTPTDAVNMMQGQVDSAGEVAKRAQQENSMNVKGQQRVELNPAGEHKNVTVGSRTPADAFNMMQGQVDFVDAALIASVQAFTKADTKVRSWKGTAGPSSAIGALLGAIHACATAIAIIVIVWRGIQSLSNPQGQILDSTVEGRSALLDNTKWIAQLLVIYNHVLYYMSVSDMEPWLHGAEPLIRRILVFDSYLINPLFCFISGVVSQGQPTARRLSRFVQYLIIPTCLYGIVVIDFLPFLALPSLETLGAIPGLLTTMHDPSRWPWYLISLCVWRASVYLLWSHLPKPVAFAGMCIVSCGGGYVPVPPGGVHGLNATVAYLPHFGLGYSFPFHEVARRIQKPRMAVSAFIVLLLWIIATIIQWLLPKGTFPDGHGWYGCCGQNVNLKFWWLRRLSKVVLDISAVLPVVFLVVPRTRLPLTHLGNHTLYSYLFHGVAFEWRKQLWSMYPPPQLNSAVMHCMIICFYYVPWSLVTLLTFTSPVWRSLWGWALTPTWLDKCFATLEKHAAAFWPRGHIDAKDSSDKKSGTDEPDKQEVAKKAMMQDATEKAEDKPVAEKTAGSMDKSY